MLRAILNKSWHQHSTRHPLYGHLPPIMKTIQARRTRHAGHCWRSEDELISDVLQWTPAYCQANAGRPARTDIHQLCEDTACSPEDLPEVMNDRGKSREWVRDIPASGTTWYIYIYIYIYIYNSFPHIYIYIYIYIYILCFIRKLENSKTTSRITTLLDRRYLSEFKLRVLCKRSCSD